MRAKLSSPAATSEPLTGVAEPAVSPLLATARKPLGKRLMLWVRRAHLYLGLFLFPWALLYGVTAFLFNHPTVFSDQPTAAFGKEALTGTPLESLPSPDEQAAAVLERLNEARKPPTPYVLAGPARYAGREFAFATAKAEGETISVLINVKDGSGTLRSSPNPGRKEPAKAPFAVGGSFDARGIGGRGAGRGKAGPGAETASAIKLNGALHDRVKEAVPTILERNGFQTGPVTVTSVPSLTFPVEAEGRVWTATYDPMTGAVSGTPADAKPATEMSVRRFLLRLHTAHGYPGEVNGRWAWAAIVDVMAATMCYWGLSGLVMWWQLKATRKLGLVILLLSASAATALGFAMHAALTL